jgi:enamine deaminase RidA (YjgF/YER057c/UK114 family)
VRARHDARARTGIVHDETGREKPPMSIDRRHVGPRMSQIVVHGDTVYLAGQVADDPSADVAGQTKQIVDKIDRYLAEAGTNKSKVLSATVWLSDIKTFNEMNGVWDAWVAPGNPPARACVEAKLAQPQYRVEIGVIAAR